MDFKEKVQEKMNQLSTEAQNLIEERGNIYGRVDEINTRLAQIVGALQELDALVKEDNDESV